jgi:hypothetical protein
MLHEDKPSLEDLALMHYGVMGMKWGKTRAKADGLEIRSARARVDSMGTNYLRAKRAAKKAPKGSERQKKRLAEAEAFKKKWQKMPERGVAARMTRGEKVVSVILLGPLAAIPIATSSAASRRIEKKQDDKAYDKK